MNADSADSELVFASSGPHGVHYTCCWSCMTNCHFDPPEIHPWWDGEDVEHAAKTGQPKPTGRCACWCGQP